MLQAISDVLRNTFARTGLTQPVSMVARGTAHLLWKLNGDDDSAHGRKTVRFFARKHQWCGFQSGREVLPNF